jgi:farnesol dehydrogenase
MQENEVPVFVTGGTGFIGSELIRKLLVRGKRVHALARSVDKAQAMLPDERIKWFKGDLHDFGAIRRGMDGCDQVYHLAGFAKLWHKDQNKFYEVNVEGLRNILDSAADTGVRKVVYTSTAGAIGPSGDEPVSENTARVFPPTTDYEKSKVASEAIIPEYMNKGLKVVTVNPTRVFGPGELNQSNSVTILIKDYMLGKWRFLPGDGSGIGNYAYVNDVADGHILAMKNGTNGERYILGGKNLSYQELFDSISTITDTRIKMYNVPVSVIMAFAKFERMKADVLGLEPLITPGFARKYLYNWETDHNKAVRDIGYKVIPFETALQRTIDWLRAEV